MERQRQQARASWAGSGDTETEAVWFAMRERAGASEFLGYETERAEGVVAALVRDGKEIATLKAGETGAVVLNQNAVLRRGGRTGRRHRDHECRGRTLSRHGHAEEGRRPDHPSRGRRAGHPRAGQRACARGRSRPAHRDPAQSFGNSSAARGVASGAGRSCRHRRAPWLHPTGCASIFPPQADERGRDRGGRGHRQRRRAAQYPGFHDLWRWRMRGHPGHVRCSARGAATRCASWRWARGGNTMG